MSEHSPSPSQHSSEEEHRRYTTSITKEDRQQSFEIEDERWQRRKQIIDWLILAGMVAVNLLWQLIVYFFEPGLR